MPNASPLILLGKIDRLPLIREIASNIRIPKEVAVEVLAGPDSDPARIWLSEEGQLLVEESPTVVDRNVRVWGLGIGESAVISMSLQVSGAVAILDDRAARNCARVFQVSVIGTAGVLLNAKRNGCLSRVRPELDALAKKGAFIHPVLRQEVLRIAEES